MSSIYRLICLSHNPGLVLDTEWQSGLDGRAVAERTLTTIKDMPQEWGEGNDELLSHAHCDLVIGSYSYPLVEVGWHPAGSRSDYVKWIDRAWLTALALLYAGYAARNVEPSPLLQQGETRFWTVDRIDRLRGELRFELPVAVGKDVQTTPCGCLRWCWPDAREAFGQEHHPACDGTGQRSDPPLPGGAVIETR